MIELEARSCTDRELRRDTNRQSASYAIYVSHVYPIETNLFQKVSTANDFPTVKKAFYRHISRGAERTLGDLSGPYNI